MKKISLMFAIALSLAVALSPSFIKASSNTKIDLLQDRSAGGIEDLDMDGPAGFGFVNYNQNDGDDLRLVVSLKNAEPNTTYSGAFLVCGPTHGTACGFIDVGDLTTNNQGNGNATIMLDVETLQATPFGPGSRTDHFDLIGPAGDVYVVTGLDYIVP